MLSIGKKTFSPNKTVTFFEHANLPDLNNYHFLSECLIDKVFNHLFLISENPDYSQRKYRYSLSFNKYIENLFIKRVAKEVKLETPFSRWLELNLTSTSTDSLADVLDAFDSHFEQSKIQKLTDSEAHSLKLGNFYIRTYFPEYKEWAEKQSLEQMLFKLTNNTSNKEVSYGVFGSFNSDDEITAIATSYLLKQSGYGVIDDLLINAKDRNITQTKAIIDTIIFHMEKECERLEIEKLEFVLLRISPKMKSQFQYLLTNKFKNIHKVDCKIENNGIWLISHKKDKLSSSNNQLIKQIISDSSKHRKGI